MVRRLAVLALAPVKEDTPLRIDCDTLPLVTLEPMLLAPSCSMAHSLSAVSRVHAGAGRCRQVQAGAAGAHMSTICRSLPLAPSTCDLPPLFMLLSFEYLHKHTGGGVGY